MLSERMSQLPHHQLSPPLELHRVVVMPSDTIQYPCNKIRGHWVVIISRIILYVKWKMGHNTARAAMPAFLPRLCGINYWLLCQPPFSSSFSVNPSRASQYVKWCRVDTLKQISNPLLNWCIPYKPIRLCLDLTRYINGR
jgi:hypothetical protein